MLRRHDCRVTIPYIDWGRISHTWRQSTLYTPEIMGTDGDAKHYNCVTNGPFKLPWKVNYLKICANVHVWFLLEMVLGD